MSRTEDNAVDRSRLRVVLGSAPPRYLTVAEAAHASGSRTKRWTARSDAAICEQASCAHASASTPTTS
jgi:hypothetical protein